MSLNDNQSSPDPDIRREETIPEAELVGASASRGVVDSGSDSPQHNSISDDGARLDAGAAPQPVPVSPRRRRKWLLPALFVATCLSTFFVGGVAWNPLGADAAFLFDLFLGDAMPLRRFVVRHGPDGLIYMGCLMAILVTHEMGHYLTACWYRVPATPPIFLPLPISPIGTMGAVIRMKGAQADRRQIFDIGIAGPLAGLVVALPVVWIGTQKLDLTDPGMGAFRLDLPIAVQWAMGFIQPKGYTPDVQVWQNHLNPYFMAGWVGFLITGLNMMPVSQLDGGHVAYTLFGRWAHWFARAFMYALVGMIVFDWVMGFCYGQLYLHVGDRWWLMVLLVFIIGTDHPPTRDDTVPLGWFRTILGLISLSIPVLCFAPRVFFSS